MVKRERELGLIQWKIYLYSLTQIILSVDRHKFANMLNNLSLSYCSQAKPKTGHPLSALRIYLKCIIYSKSSFRKIWNHWKKHVVSWWVNFKLSRFTLTFNFSGVVLISKNDEYWYICLYYKYYVKH